MKYTILLFLISLPLQAKTLNCTDPKTQKQYRTRCSKVLDPMKFKRGEKSFVNCAGELEDGYQHGICEKVDLKFQLTNR